jgi:aspartate aminotransferase
MSQPMVSEYYAQRKPSSIRVAQIAFAQRRDDVRAINLAIGNVSLPVHPAMARRLHSLSKDSLEAEVIKYTPTLGLEEANRAFLHVLASGGFPTEGLYSQVTDGGTLGMELMILGVCGEAGSDDRPLMMIEPIYTNYPALARRLGRATVSIRRTLQEDGRFTLPDLAEIEAVIRETRPGGLLVIPYDNPTGQMMRAEALAELARLCVRYNLWLISDESYRMLYYVSGEPVSVWGLTEEEVPGIRGRRISIETASKVWNACGLRIGALITDSRLFHDKALAEQTTNLCASKIGQEIFGALAEESFADLGRWYEKQCAYYSALTGSFTAALREALPGVIVSSPDAALYSVVDVRNLVKEGFDSGDFVLYCATRGKVDMNGEELTLLTAPLSGFYTDRPGAANPGKTQMRVAYVEPPENMDKAPRLFAELLRAYEAER